MNEVNFLILAEVIEIHRDLIRRYGGQPGVRDFGLLESALAMPQASFAGVYLHPDLFTMAAAYAFHICNNHAFVDGNKRTALVSALVFLELNGITVDDPRGTLYEAVMDLAIGKTDKYQLAAILRCLAS